MSGTAPDEPDAPAEPVEIPFRELSPDALQGVLEAYVLREGTDYGERVFTLEQKVAQVRGHLERGTARVMFDPLTETVTVVETRH